MILSMVISLAIYVLVALAAVMSVPWEELANSDAPLVLMANKSLGGKGWIVISLGGILASLGALSSTLVSQSRQTYAMGKDRFSRITWQAGRKNAAAQTGNAGGRRTDQPHPADLRPEVHRQGG